MSTRETFIITIRDAASRHETRPVAIRLRTLLKLMLRGFGLRCTDIRPAVSNVGVSDEPTAK